MKKNSDLIFPDAVDSIVLMEQAFSHLWESLLLLLPDPRSPLFNTSCDTYDQWAVLLNQWSTNSRSIFFMRASLIFSQSRLDAIRHSLRSHEGSQKLSKLHLTIRQTNNFSMDYINRSLAKLAELNIWVYRNHSRGLGDRLLTIFGNCIHTCLLILENIAYTRLWWSSLLHSIPDAYASDNADDITPKLEHVKKLQNLLLSLSTEIEKSSNTSGLSILHHLEEFTEFLHRYSGSVSTEPIIVLWKNKAPPPRKPWINGDKNIGPAKP